jgi:signal transduction histidine kinase
MSRIFAGSEAGITPRTATIIGETMSIDIRPSRANFYGRLWANVPRELGFLLLALPLGIVGFVPAISMFFLGLGTLVTFFIGVIVLIAVLYMARGFGTLTLIRLEWAGRPRIERPEWQDRRARLGFWGWLRAVLFNGHYWLALLHTVVVNFAISLFSWIVTIVWVFVGLGGISYWFWDRFIPGHSDDRHLAGWFLWLVGASPRGVDLHLVADLVCLGAGIILLATLPFVTRALMLIHQGCARALLGAWKSDALQRQVIDLSASRGAAISAEGHSLRRLERDIHDGPQQRLVRLQMDLAAADRQLDADPERARGLIAEAMQQSRDALEELRALSRGFAPPILLDRGLIAAIESAATRSAIPTRVVNELPAGAELPQEIERNAYFVASEALTNVIKHSTARDVEVRVGLRRLDGLDETWLDVVVTDDGIGGAVPTVGHGLAGLEERMRGLGGTLEVLSPAGGPTAVSAHLPVALRGSA